MSEINREWGAYTLMEHIILGAGEVGLALQQIFICDLYDPYVESYSTLSTKCYDCIHVCYNFNEEFITITNDYINIINPEIVVIHSTVPIGTTRQLGTKAVHSPIIGNHPQLKESILTFAKFVGAIDKDIAIKISNYFESKGIASIICDNPETTEALKLFLTLRFALSVLEMKKIFEFCKKSNLNPNIVYTLATLIYNLGYTNMGMTNIIRPVLNLEEGPIGGHCLIRNLDFLPKELEDLKYIIKINNDKWGK